MSDIKIPRDIRDDYITGATVANRTMAEIVRATSVRLADHFGTLDKVKREDYYVAVAEALDLRKPNGQLSTSTAETMVTVGMMVRRFPEIGGQSVRKVKGNATAVLDYSQDDIWQAKVLLTTDGFGLEAFKAAVAFKRETVGASWADAKAHVGFETKSRKPQAPKAPSEPIVSSGVSAAGGPTDEDRLKAICAILRGCDEPTTILARAMAMMTESQRDDVFDKAMTIVESGVEALIG